MPKEAKAKPDIEEAMDICLDGGMRESALGYVAWLQADGMRLTWASASIWKANYKGEAFCAVQLPSPNYSPYRNSWVISPHLNNIESYGDKVIKEGLLETYLRCMAYCDHGAGRSGRGCSPNRPCAGGEAKAVLGRVIKGVCNSGCNAAFAHTRIADPDAEAVNGIKALLRLEKEARENKPRNNKAPAIKDAQPADLSIAKHIMDYLHARPRIEDAATMILKGERLGGLLDFAGWLRANGFPIIWVHWCRWRVGAVCDIDVSHVSGAWHWNVNFNAGAFGEDSPRLSEPSRRIASSHVRLCKYCGGCGPGRGLKLLGNAYEKVCHQTLRFWDPGAEELTCAKQLVSAKLN